MKNTDPEEWFPIVDENGNTIGKELRRICHDGRSMLLHPVVHLHLFNSRGELFLQKRAMTKDIQPGKWDTSVGGHVGLGETPDDGLIREACEELGIYDFAPHFLIRYIWQSLRERELVHSYSTISDAPLKPNKTEIDEGRFWNLEEIKINLDQEIFTPNFEHEYKMLFLK